MGYLENAHYDRRFFYVKDKTGYYACGLARDTIATALRKLGEDRKFMERGWFNRIESSGNNPSVLGFLVEQACLSYIGSTGLTVGEQKFLVTNIRHYEDNALPSLDMTRGTTTLYIPIRFNNKAIDGFILHLPKLKAGNTAKLLPIQITIAKKHSDSVGAFLTDWAKWKNELQSYKVDLTFVWIVEKGRNIGQLAEKERMTRTSTVEVRPERTMRTSTVEDRPEMIEVRIPVIEVSAAIGSSLQIARERAS